MSRAALQAKQPEEFVAVHPSRQIQGNVVYETIEQVLLALQDGIDAFLDSPDA